MFRIVLSAKRPCMNGAEVGNQERDPQLIRTLDLYDLTLLVIGSVIGSGIFFVPSTVVRQLNGDTGLTLLAWLAGGVLSYIGALTLAELTTMRPEAGGIYVFIRECFGRLPSFLYGWTLFFVISAGTAAALASAFSENLRHVIPMSTLEAKATAVTLLVVLAIVNVWGTRHSANLQNITTLIKIGSILIISGIIFWKAHGAVGSQIFLPEPVSWSVGSNFGLAMVSILWAYEGWQYATYSAGETLNPQRNFPRAFLMGTGVVITLYLIVNVAYVAILGKFGVMESHNVAADAMNLAIGRYAGAVVVMAIAVSVLSGANALILTNPRVYFAMAKDGVFFSKLARIHPRFHTPAFAIVAGTGWAAVLTLSGTFEQLLTYVIFTGWLFYALAGACVFVYRRRFPKAERKYEVPGYPITPIVFLLVAGALAINTVVHEPRRSLAGLAIVAVGLPAYRIWKRRVG